MCLSQKSRKKLVLDASVSKGLPNAEGWIKFVFRIIVPLEHIISLIEKISGVTREEHYGRLALDDHMNYPKKFNETYFSNSSWVGKIDAACHQFTSSDQSNIKYVSIDGRYEAIYDYEHNLVEDVRDVGTYNYASPTDDPWNHFLLDVIPWIFWGNSQDDTTTIAERLNAFFIDGLQEKVGNLFFDLMQ